MPGDTEIAEAKPEEAPAVEAKAVDEQAASMDDKLATKTKAEPEVIADDDSTAKKKTKKAASKKPAAKKTATKKAATKTKVSKKTVAKKATKKTTAKASDKDDSIDWVEPETGYVRLRSFSGIYEAIRGISDVN